MGGRARAPGPGPLCQMGGTPGEWDRSLGPKCKAAARAPGDTGAEVGAAESSPVIHRDRVCRDDAVPSADTAKAKGTSALTFLAISDSVSLRIQKGCVTMQG